MDCTPTRQPPQKGLIVGHSDGYLQFFAEKNIKFKYIQCPTSSSDEAAIIAEDVVELLLPPPWRALYLPGKMQGSAMLRPLPPAVLADSIAVNDCIAGLNSLVSVPAVQGEAMTWTL